MNNLYDNGNGLYYVVSFDNKVLIYICGYSRLYNSLVKAIQSLANNIIKDNISKIDYIVVANYNEGSICALKALFDKAKELNISIRKGSVFFPEILINGDENNKCLRWLTKLYFNYNLQNGKYKNCRLALINDMLEYKAVASRGLKQDISDRNVSIIALPLSHNISLVFKSFNKNDSELMRCIVSQIIENWEKHEKISKDDVNSLFAVSNDNPSIILVHKDKSKMEFYSSREDKWIQQYENTIESMLTIP
ncbi:MAG: hypothetical protein E7338_04860 [Clostridiales bacterium]|nr:hypothetical protein [Clostridiales bacterium]